MKDKRPAHVLLGIPIAFVVSVSLLVTGGLLDNIFWGSNAAEQGHGVPIFTTIFLLIAIAVFVVVTIISIIRFIVRLIKKDKG